MAKKKVSEIGRKTFIAAQRGIMKVATNIRNDLHQPLDTVAHLIRWGDADEPDEIQIINLVSWKDFDKDSVRADDKVREKLKIMATKMKANAVILVKEGVVHIVSKHIIGDVPVAICWFETSNGETHTWTSFMPDGKIDTWDCDSKIMSACPYRGIVDKNYVAPALTGAG